MQRHVPCILGLSPRRGRAGRGCAFVGRYPGAGSGTSVFSGGMDKRAGGVLSRSRDSVCVFGCWFSRTQDEKALFRLVTSWWVPYWAIDAFAEQARPHLMLTPCSREIHGVAKGVFPTDGAKNTRMMRLAPVNEPRTHVHPTWLQYNFELALLRLR